MTRDPQPPPAFPEPVRPPLPPVRHGIRHGVWATVLGLFTGFIILAFPFVIWQFVKSILKEGIFGRALAVCGLVVGCLAGWEGVKHEKVHLAIAMQANCSLNLSNIGKAAIIYSKAHQDTLPPDLETLAKNSEDISPQRLHCLADDNDVKCSYIYAPGKGPADDRIVACDRKPIHNGKRNVLRADGAVMVFAEEDFQAELKKPENAALAEAVRKAPQN